jgi:hypothetical protein
MFHTARKIEKPNILEQEEK